MPTRSSGARAAPHRTQRLAALLAVAVLGACGGGGIDDSGGDIPEPPPKSLHCAPEPGRAGSAVAAGACTAAHLS